jgi:hypothetical protein
MAKPTLPHAELLKRVRLLLESHPLECGNLRLDGLEIDDQPEDGANWHLAWTRLSGNEDDIRACRSKILDELAALRSAYDCEIPEPPATPGPPLLW